MNQNTKLLIDLPSDILLQIFGKCDVPDILSFSSACKRLQLAVDEHQVWLRQATRLQIPIPPGTTPSKAELKDWVISRARVDFCWIKRRPGNLELHSFETDDEFVDAYILPGGEFVVFLYENGDVGLNKIERTEGTGEWVLREVARHEEPDEGQHPSFCSRLLTETSYGCPVLVWAGASVDTWDPSPWAGPLTFFIDTGLQVIEKKQYRYHGFDDFYIDSVCEILAAGDRMFFICDNDGVPTVLTALVSEPSPDMVTGRFALSLPGGWDAEYRRSDGQFFLVSEKGLIASSHAGIYLYHIPELGDVGDDVVTISPQWSWDGYISGCSTICKTVSLHPAFWIQGRIATHTLEFDMDGSGCFPIVANHQITEGQPAYHVGSHLKLQGRKGIVVSFGVGGYKEIVINTVVFGRPGITRRLRAELPGVDVNYRRRRLEVKYAGLDEVTGRIMIVVGTVPCHIRGVSTSTIPYARRLYLADIPT